MWSSTGASAATSATPVSSRGGTSGVTIRADRITIPKTIRYAAHQGVRRRPMPAA